ncbi:DCC1-like thiol-disulfide oxidoreductase family protein [Tautonia marina]|uniref:DCC1-like thiol-disulfide oxidoreductase family protein n=1 Tax=Tautonia marina TaxID=2653855 RepID=UPI001261102E|nr:DCC1-like thiol-disulfide oxidoreductase family protein [Tautonia marina]
MRRLITGPVAYFSSLGRATADGWNAFLFRPADPTPVGLIRLGLGLLLLWNYAILGLDLHAFLGSGGWADPEVLGFFRNLERDRWSWSLWSIVPDAMLVPAYVGCLVVLLLFTVGLWSRTTAVLTWLIVVSTVRRTPVMVFGFDQAASMLLLYLAVTGASGRAVSLDRFFERLKGTREAVNRGRSATPLECPVGDGRPKASIPANLCLRLIQVHLCIIYGLAGLAKLQHPIWWEGFAFMSLLGYAEFRPVDLTWLARWPMVLMLFSHGALWLEILYPVLVWVKRLRPLVISLTIALHLGIAVTMGLYEFALAMIVANMAFVSGPWLRSLVTGTNPEPLRVLYDGACGLCRTSVAMGSAADPGRMIDWIDVTTMEVKAVHPSLDDRACLESVHCVGPGDRVRSGFQGVVAVARRVPLIWPVGLLGGLPGVSAVGQALYDRVSKSRHRDPAWEKRPQGADPQKGTSRPPNRPEKPRARR